MLIRPWLLLATISLGCSEEPKPPPATSDDASASVDAIAVETDGDASVDDTIHDGDIGGASDTTSDGELACNSLVSSGSDVTTERVAMTPPTLAGGTIADGTYVLTKLIEYTGPEGPTGAGEGPYRSTLSLTGGIYELIWVQSTGTGATRGTSTHDASSLTWTETCPGAETVHMGFEATPTSIKFSRSAGSGGVELTYEKW